MPLSASEMVYLGSELRRSRSPSYVSSRNWRLGMREQCFNDVRHPQAGDGQHTSDEVVKGMKAPTDAGCSVCPRP